ncbi:phage protease [Enterocloster lavalensis]|uniref:phage protease n=1 Tax=Enterocloster lavalensis TaxID=460384 RepID=UPI001D088352|nr:phage protease [Enterocloster lavalensis]MCB6345410.1 phage protease [Enterocloster lavalensis]
MKKNQLTVRVLSGIDVGEVPEVIRLLPKGHVSTRKGDFEVDEQGIADMIRQFKARKLDLVIDYEHQTLNDVQAPASGWIKDLYAGPDALMAKVEWTPKGREYIANKEYRYLSPVVLVTQKDRRAVLLHSAALTNTPAIDGMFAIINSDDLDVVEDEEEKESKVMELEKLIKLLGLEEGATEEDILNKLTEILEKVEDPQTKEKTDEPGKDEAEMVANKTVLDLLGLPESAKTEDVAAKIMSFKAGDSILKSRVEQLEKQAAQRIADDLVEMALKEGKISAAQSDWASAYALKDPKGFALFAEKAPVVVPMGKITTAKDSREKLDVDMVILKNQGVTEEDLKKYGGME